LRIKNETYPKQISSSQMLLRHFFPFWETEASKKDFTQPLWICPTQNILRHILWKATINGIFILSLFHDNGLHLVKIFQPKLLLYVIAQIACQKIAGNESGCLTIGHLFEEMQTTLFLSFFSSPSSPLFFCFSFDS
jgi:hypothetical protein